MVGVARDVLDALDNGSFFLSHLFYKSLLDGFLDDFDLPGAGENQELQVGSAINNRFLILLWSSYCFFGSCTRIFSWVPLQFDALQPSEIVLANLVGGGIYFKRLRLSLRTLLFFGVGLLNSHDRCHRPQAAGSTHLHALAEVNVGRTGVAPLAVEDGNGREAEAGSGFKKTASGGRDAELRATEAVEERDYRLEKRLYRHSEWFIIGSSLT